jgi:RNA polymerase sigma factor (sigma-70 family)
VSQASEDAFDAAFDRLRALAYRAGYRLLGARADAEDIAAETLARAYSRWGSISDHAEPWVVTTATNLALDQFRRARTAASHRHVLVEPQPAVDHLVETRLDLVRALTELPRRQREVVALRFLADYSEAATAQALGIDVGTVKSHTSRALSRLRTLVPPATAAPVEGAGDVR